MPLRITTAKGSTAPLSLTPRGPGSPASAIGTPLSHSHRPQAPRTWHAPQLVLASVLELDLRADDQVLDGVRDQELARTRRAEDPRRDVHRDTADVVAHHLDLAGMQAGSKVEIELGPGDVAHRGRAADRARRAIERGQQPIA